LGIEGLFEVNMSSWGFFFIFAALTGLNFT